MDEKNYKDILDQLEQCRCEKEIMNVEIQILRCDLEKKEDDIDLLNHKISEKDTKIFMLEDFLKTKEKQLADNNLTQFTIKVSAIGYALVVFLLCLAYFIFKL